MEYTFEVLGDPVTISAMELAIAGMAAGIAVAFTIWMRH
jgi:H+/Cl- antiporter ClcA